MKMGQFTCTECEAGPCKISIGNKPNECGKFKRRYRKETELMTLQEVIRGTTPDCIIRDKRTGEELKARDYENQKLSLEAALSDQWQAIPVEPVALSEDSLLRKAMGAVYHNGDDTTTEWLLSIIQDSDKNGQLKQWLKHKELRGAVDQFLRVEITKHNDEMNFKRLIKAFKNIGPFNSES